MRHHFSAEFDQQKDDRTETFTIDCAVGQPKLLSEETEDILKDMVDRLIGNPSLKRRGICRSPCSKETDLFMESCIPDSLGVNVLETEMPTILDSSTDKFLPRRSALMTPTRTENAMTPSLVPDVIDTPLSVTRTDILSPLRNSCNALSSQKPFSKKVCNSPVRMQSSSGARTPSAHVNRHMTSVSGSPRVLQSQVTTEFPLRRSPRLLVSRKPSSMKTPVSSPCTQATPSPRPSSGARTPSARVNRHMTSVSGSPKVLQSQVMTEFPLRRSPRLLVSWKPSSMKAPVSSPCTEATPYPRPSQYTQRGKGTMADDAPASQHSLSRSSPNGSIEGYEELRSTYGSGENYDHRPKKFISLHDVYNVDDMQGTQPRNNVVSAFWQVDEDLRYSGPYRNKYTSHKTKLKTLGGKQTTRKKECTVFERLTTSSKELICMLILDVQRKADMYSELATFISETNSSDDGRPFKGHRDYDVGEKIDMIVKCALENRKVFLRGKFIERNEKIILSRENILLSA